MRHIALFPGFPTDQEDGKLKERDGGAGEQELCEDFRNGVKNRGQQENNQVGDTPVMRQKIRPQDFDLGQEMQDQRQLKQEPESQTQ